MGDVDGDGTCNELDACPEDVGDDCVEAVLPSLFGQWRFDGDLRDSSGGSHHATAAGAVEYVPGLSGRAAILDSGASAPLPDALVPLTLRMRLRPDAAEGRPQGVVVSESGSLRLRWQDGGVSLDGVDLVAPAPAGRWSEVVLVLTDDASARLYVDGARIGEAALPDGLDDLAPLSGALWLGSGIDGAGPLAGALDDVALWAGTLDDGQVWLLANR